MSSPEPRLCSNSSIARCRQRSVGSTLLFSATARRILAFSGDFTPNWQRSELTDVTAKVVIYEAFVEAHDSAFRCLEGASVFIVAGGRNRHVCVGHELRVLHQSHNRRREMPRR